MYRILFSFALVVSNFSIGQNEIYNEDFQSGIPASYTIVDNDGLTPHSSVSDFASAWIALEDPDNSSDTVVGSTSYFDPSGRADRWIITPSIALGAFGNVLYWDAKSHDASFMDGYYIFVSTTDTQLSSFTDTIFYTSAESADWTTHVLSLSAEGYNNTAVHLAFVNRTNDGFKLYLDDIRIEEENPLALQELENNITIYPNPASKQITIEGVFNRVIIHSLEGREVLVSEEAKIDIEHLPNGVYSVRILNNGRSLTKKLVKQ